MRLVVLNLNLGPGRHLQPADLNYFLDGTSAIVYFNQDGLGIRDWADAGTLNASLTTKAKALSYTKVGIFNKWATKCTIDNYNIVVVDVSIKKSVKAILRQTKKFRKSDNLTILCGDWDEFSESDFATLRSETGMAWYGYGRDGVFVSDAGAVTNIARLGVSHSGNNVVAVDIK